MSELIEIQTKTETTKLFELTTRQLAEAFMGLDSGKQAEFFGHCADIQADWGGLGSMQWYSVKNECRQEYGGWNDAGYFIMDLSAPFYPHALGLY